MSQSPAQAIRVAVQQAKLAYEFSAGSYTFGALSACLAAADALPLERPDWIAAFLEHQGSAA